MEAADVAVHPYVLSRRKDRLIFASAMEVDVDVKTLHVQNQLVGQLAFVNHMEVERNVLIHSVQNRVLTVHFIVAHMAEVYDAHKTVALDPLRRTNRFVQLTKGQ